MIDWPRTLAEAKKRRYGVWVNEPRGRHFREQHCAYEISYPGGLGQGWRQCFRRGGYGPSNLYCRQHAEKIAKED